MLYGICAASLKDIVESDNIRFYVHVRVGNGISYARLSREIYDYRKAVFCEKLVDKRSVGDIALYESPFAISL